LRKFKRGDMRNKCPNIRVLQGPIYTRAKMRVYAGLVNYAEYASTKCPFYENSSSCMIAMKITLTRNRKYGGSGEMAYLGLSAI